MVIPVHNKGGLLAESLASVAAQTCRDFEVIVVDDASTDDGLLCIDAFQGLPLRVLHRSTPGPGGYAARNLGIQEARGAWIAFLDADDLWRPDHLAIAADWLDRFPETGVYCSGFEEILSGSVKSIAVGESRCFSCRQFLSLYARRDLFHTNSMVIRRQLLLDCGGFPEHGVRRGGDHALWFRTVLSGAPVMLAAAVTSCYRRDHSAVVSDPVTMAGAHPVCRVASDALAGVIPLPGDWGAAERRLIRQFANRKSLHWMLQRRRMGLGPSPGQRLPYPAALSPLDLLRWLMASLAPPPLLRSLLDLKARLS